MYFPFPTGLGRRTRPLLCKNAQCITGESALTGRKISCALRIVPPSLWAVWENPWGLAFHAIWNIKHCSHLFSRWELLCFPFPAGLGEMMWPTLCKNTPVHNGRVGPRCGKNLPRFPNCPAIAPGSLGKPLGFEFPCNLECKTLLPPFLPGGSFCVSHSLRDCEEEQSRPAAKMRRCITGETALAGRKIFRALRIVPPSPRAVWESPWGLVFSCNPEYKTLLPPFLSPAGAGMKK